MARPTQFDLMRLGRIRALYYARPLPVAQATEPAAPFMEIYGVRYVEAPETIGCDGCEFRRSAHECSRVAEVARAAFGYDCVGRHVIYLKAA